MSEVYIHYSTLDDAINKSKKARSEISGYIEEIKKKITTPISNLNGADSSGYASTASTLAWQKISNLTDKASRFVSFEDSVRNFSSFAKNKDKYVSGQIETVASMYVKERTWYQKAGDWLYNTFCVDIPNKFDWTRSFFDCAKRVFGDIGDALEKVHDWFKYGDGKYILNITLSVLGTVAAIGGAIAAICAIPFTGGATIPIVIGCIGAAAASVGAVITTVNSVTSITQNAKALSLSGDVFDANDGNPGAARYYGNTSKLSDYWKKNDMGDEATNKGFEKAGKIIDTTKTVADVTSFVCSIASLGNVHDYRIKNGNADINIRYNGDKWYKGYSFTYDNIKRNIMHDMGFKISSGKLDGGKAFGQGKSIFAKTYTVDKKFTLRWDGGSWSVNEKLVKLFRGAKVTKNVIDIKDNLQTVNDVLSNTTPSLSDIGDLTEAVVGLGSNSKIFKIFDDYGVKTGNTIVDVFKIFAN